MAADSPFPGLPRAREPVVPSLQSGGNCPKTCRCPSVVVLRPEKRGAWSGTCECRVTSELDAASSEGSPTCEGHPSHCEPRVGLALPPRRSKNTTTLLEEARIKRILLTLRDTKCSQEQLREKPRKKVGSRVEVERRRCNLSARSTRHQVLAGAAPRKT
jgi:hypothetical protein